MTRADSVAADVGIPSSEEERGRSYGHRSLIRTMLQTREGRSGTFLVGLMLAVTIFGPLLAPDSPTATGAGTQLQGPSPGHLLGTDGLGRDVLSRVLNGGGGTVGVAFLGVLVALAVGASGGLLAGYRGGRLDTIIARTTDVGLSLPPLLIVLVLLVGAGDKAWVLVLGVGIVFAPRIARVVRGATQAAATNDYVTAARARGEGPVTIVFNELLPNLTGPLSVEFALRCTHAIIFVASLNFLGFGAQPPSSNWGLVVAEERSVLAIQPLASLAPAACIAVLTIGLNLVADAAARATAREVGPIGELR